MGGRPGGPAEPAAAPMLTLQPGMDRLNHELSAHRDRLIRIHSVQTDLALDLPPSIPLPDGEEIPYGSSTRLKIRDPQQQSEICQKCIRPPPNKTVFDGESPPPYRSSSAGLLASDWPGSSSGGKSVARCHSMSAPPNKRSGDFLGRTVRCFSGKRNQFPGGEEPAPAPPCVNVPTVIVPSHRSRKLAAFSENAGTSLASVPAVSCAVPASYYQTGDTKQRSEPSSDDKMRSHSLGASSCEARATDGADSKSERGTV